jgi:hypothetical protein
MKNIPIVALVSVLFASAGIATARPHAVIVVEQNGPSYQVNYHHHHRERSLTARAQMRLREFGYYHGPVDGDFGRYSRHALIRFQRDHGLYPNGMLNERTRRALGI